jgi:hypothetical protein
MVILSLLRLWQKRFFTQDGTGFGGKILDFFTVLTPPSVALFKSLILRINFLWRGLCF